MTLGPVISPYNIDRVHYIKGCISAASWQHDLHSAEAYAMSQSPV